MAKKKKKTTKARRKKRKPAARVGCYGSTSDHVLMDMGKRHSVIPVSLDAALHEENPTWDYCVYMDWLVLRTFENGVEDSRILAHIVHTVKK